MKRNRAPCNDAPNFRVRQFSCHWYSTKKDGEDWIALDYQCHILPHVAWNAIGPPDPRATAPQSVKWQSATVDLDEAPPIYHADQDVEIDKTVRVSDFTRHLSDTVPNLWHTARIARELIEGLERDGASEEDIYDRRAYLAHLFPNSCQG